MAPNFCKLKRRRFWTQWARNSIDCSTMKRIGIILKHFHCLTSALTGTQHRYPYLIRQFLSTLNETNRTQFLDDFDHVLKHNKAIRCAQPYLKCESATSADYIHLRRANRACENHSLSRTVRTRNWETGNDWKDFVFISYLDKIHCTLLHTNLRQELTNNVVYPISDSSFGEAILASTHKLNTNQFQSRTHWRATETNDFFVREL